MKFFTSFLTATLLSTSAFADNYQFSVSSTDPGKIIIAKDCLDYNFCGGEGSSLAGGNPDYRLHTFIQLNDQQLQSALDTCNFKKLEINISIKNLTKNIPVTINPLDNGSDIRLNLPGIFIKKMDDSEKLAKYNIIKQLIEQKQNQLAINAVISEYNLSTDGYAISFGGNMGDAGATTDHQTKTIKVSDLAFQDACVLIQTMRHELEHVAQIAKLNRCESTGKSHNFIDHVTRERSAYLNDMRNIPLFCPDQRTSNWLVESTADTFFKTYTTKK